MLGTSTYFHSRRIRVQSTPSTARDHHMSHSRRIGRSGKRWLYSNPQEVIALDSWSYQLSIGGCLYSKCAKSLTLYLTLYPFIDSRAADKKVVRWQPDAGSGNNSFIHWQSWVKLKGLGKRGQQLYPCQALQVGTDVWRAFSASMWELGLHLVTGANCLIKYLQGHW
jgi:hypothetical protein